jgi:hypothetical protein
MQSCSGHMVNWCVLLVEMFGGYRETRGSVMVTLSAVATVVNSVRKAVDAAFCSCAVDVVIDTLV